jgi:hypothetical protein
MIKGRPGSKRADSKLYETRDLNHLRLYNLYQTIFYYNYCSVMHLIDKLQLDLALFV